MVSAKLRAQALPPKNKKKTPQAPETADEFLAAGVDEEEGGEKWRAGDIVKSSRFFTRALELYEKGLQRYPQNADLAYNRARLQYDIWQQPRLLAAFRTTANAGDTDLLQLSLDHHEYAMQLRRDDPDLVFNIGQLCRDMAEREQENQNDAGALDYYVKAKQAFLFCGELQATIMARQSQDSIPDVPPGQDSVMDEDTGAEGGESVEDDQWATVVEPVTPASIYDTAVAALQVDISMLPLWPDDVPDQPSRLAELRISGERLVGRLQELAEAAADIEDWTEQHPAWERDLLAANFRAGYQDSLCRQWKTQVSEYSTNVLQLFQRDEPPAQWLADTAEADVNLNSTLATIALKTPPGHILVEIASIRWKHVTRALNSLTSLSKLGTEATRDINLSLSTVHARRAECELLRRRLGEVSSGELNKDSGNVLASNAEKFFRGARQLAERDGEDAVDFHARELISNNLVGGQTVSQGSLAPADLERNLVEMEDEGLLSQAEARRLAS